jgi:1-acyl-sn-glycerol-3-phosphate acyltransferase
MNRSALSVSQVVSRPLPLVPRGPLDRLICRSLLLLARPLLAEIRGVEHVAVERDPFILVANHNQRAEAVLVPTVMIFFRHGRVIHFLSDWNFQMIPVLATVLRRSGVITLTQKSARPRFLNVLKPLFADPVPGMRRAQRKLESGASIGVFPEGTINRDPRNLLPGHPGAAHLSLRTGVPCVPVGIRFPFARADRPIRDRDRMLVEIGPPVTPPAPARPGRPSPDEVWAWHHALMQELARLSGKAWTPARGRSEVDEP